MNTPYKVISLVLAVFALTVSVDAADQDQQIAKLIRQLDSDNFEEREKASKELIAIGSLALEPLRKATKSPDLEVVKRANACIKEIEIDVIIARHITDLTDTNPKVRAKAANALMPFKARAASAVPRLIAAIDDNDPHVRDRATWALGRIGAAAESAVPRLIEIIRDKSENKDLRWSAAIGLEKIGRAAEKAVPVLLAMLQEESAIVRNGAAHALGGLGRHHDQVVPALLRSLRDTDLNVQGNAAVALGKIGKEPHLCVPAIVELLTKYKGFQGRGDPRYDAIWALGDFAQDAKVAVPALIDIAKDDKDASLRSRAIGLLGQIGPPAIAALPFLRSLLEDALLSEDSAKAIAMIERR